jgi:hypothetical protein
MTTIGVLNKGENMANTKKLDVVENIYRSVLKTETNTVEKEKIKIAWGGEFEFDAVIRNGGKIAEIHSLSLAYFKTTSGNQGTSKLFKVFHDAQMMLLTGCKNNVLAFVDTEFYDKVLREQKSGRFFPASQIKVVHWDLRTLGLEKGFEVRNLIDDVLIKSTDEITVK